MKHKILREYAYFAALLSMIVGKNQNVFE